ncbi:hypothetical protein FKW77_006832 [Venturia effusa]|uniref:Secreted protein n=1 Tax=Venturia effusa TaxID=50376 RepID=A0A517LJ04_9PEZI|nr:hypothetical protein FKW77_006832 [Venturia effusa]
MHFTSHLLAPLLAVLIGPAWIYAHDCQQWQTTYAVPCLGGTGRTCPNGTADPYMKDFRKNADNYIEWANSNSNTCSGHCAQIIRMDQGARGHTFIMTCNSARIWSGKRATQFPPAAEGMDQINSQPQCDVWCWTGHLWTLLGYAYIMWMGGDGGHGQPARTATDAEAASPSSADN